VGDLVPTALKAMRKGGRVVCAGRFDGAAVLVP